MYNKPQLILQQMELQSPTGQIRFSIKEIYKWLHNNYQTPFVQNISKSADYPIWSQPYLSSIFHNVTVRPKWPKVFRITIQDKFYYSLKEPI